MALTPDDVVRLAGLARIDLTDDETAYLAPPHSSAQTSDQWKYGMSR